MADLLSHFPDDELKRRGLAWRQWALAHEPVPFSLTPLQRGLLAEAVPALHRAALAVTRAFVEDASLRPLFGYSPEHEAAILTDPGYEPVIPVGRMDSFLYPDGVKFLEYNTDGTAGWHYSAGLSALWRERAGLSPEPCPLPERLLRGIRACWDGWRGKTSDSPRAALVDWAHVGTAPEQEALCAFFRDRGLACTLEDPGALRFEGGRLVGSAGPVDLVYRRVVSEEVFASPHRARAFVEAYEAGAFCCVGGFRTDPAWSKVLFCILSDPSYEGLFDPADLPVLRRTVPWTRLVRSGEARGDLRAEVLAGRERLLLKPARSYQGAGVVAGPLVTAEAWRHAVELAWERGLWVVQEFLEPVAWVQPQTGERLYLQVGEFVVRGRWAGLMARVCESAVITPQAVDRFLPVAEGVPGEVEEIR